MKKSFEKLLSNIADLLKVKSLLTLLFAITACNLATDGKVDVKDFFALVSLVVGSFLGFQSKKDVEPQVIVESPKEEPKKVEEKEEPIVIEEESEDISDGYHL